MVESMCLDHLQMVDTEQGLFVTRRALDSLANQQIVWRHIRDARDLERGMDLAIKHSERLGWPVKIAPENLSWFGR